MAKKMGAKRNSEGSGHEMEEGSKQEVVAAITCLGPALSLE